MRNRTSIFFLFVLVLALASSRRLRRRGTPEMVAGTFPNRMGYVRFGTGAKSLLWIPDPSHAGHIGPGGGPGGGALKSPYLTMMTRGVGPFVEAGYAVFLVGHKPSLPHGYTVADMAEDYARLIVEEFDGKVDLVVGDSNGGMIGFCLAARHPDLFNHIAIVVAGHTMSEAAKAANLESARMLSAGRRTDAAAPMVAFMYPEVRPPWVARLLASLMGRMSFPDEFDPSDVVTAAEAVSAFDGREILPSISVPVLLVCGDRDRFVAKEIYEQTADLIQNRTLRLYEGKGHIGTMSDKRLSSDVLEFTRRNRTSASERDASRA